MKLTSTYSDLFKQADDWAKANFANHGRAWVCNMWNNPRCAKFVVIERNNATGEEVHTFEAQIRKGQLIFPDLDEHFGIA